MLLHLKNGHSKPWKYPEYPPRGQVLNSILLLITEYYANIYIGLYTVI